MTEGILMNAPGGLSLQLLPWGARFPTAEGVCALQPDEGRNQLHDLTLELELRAWCDRPTPVAMTYHPYFNLSGIDHGTIDDHLLQVEGDEILALDTELIPTGGRIPVAATPFDFRAPAPVGQHLRTTDPQLAIAGGIDHTWLLRRDRRFDAVLRHPGSGVTLRVESNQPSLQVYTGQALSDAGGRGFVPRQALCLEPQNPPDAVNHADFPSPWLQPGERYVNRIRYVFSVDG